MISVQHISKSYRQGKGQVKALDNISFEVLKGELFGLIGPDGAGKTSLFRILTTLLLADQGIATVDDADVVKEYRHIRQRVGYMPGRFSLYQDLSVEENLQFFATIFNTTVAENYEQIKEIYVQLEPFKKRLAGKLSGGMKQKLALCCALVHRPDVLFLDEPTTGVDAVSRIEFWDILKRLKADGITVLVSTPYMEEAAKCDRVALVQGGKILSTGTPDELLKGFGQKIYAAKAASMLALLEALKQNALVKDAYPFGEYHHVILKEDRLDDLVHSLGMPDLEIMETSPDIEDCFISLMSH
ncbi:MAG: ABC transporter ATP-binding protein [Chitinophagaceae bacterium]|nr:ABC transporter ATP-binding protein [Chitinophagaceae bacterium]